jgi:hypothetical protein
MKLLSILAVAGALAVSGSAFAASAPVVAPATPAATTTAPAAMATKPAATMGKMDKTAISKKCSADADAKGLHGKDRKKFRDSCKTQAMKQG